MDQMKTLEKENAPLGEERLPILDNYVEQIRELSEKNLDLDHIIATLPARDLERDKAVLQKKLESDGAVVRIPQEERS